MRQLFDVLEYLKNSLRPSTKNIAETAWASGLARRVFFEPMRKHGVKGVSGAQAGGV
jgi:hypothetical protein